MREDPSGDSPADFSSIASVNPGKGFARVGGTTTVHLRGPEPAHLRGIRPGVVCPLWRPGQRPYERAPQVCRLDDPHRPQWHNTTVIAHDPIEAIRDLKQQLGADIVQYGFGPVSHALIAAGMLDELCLWVHPFFIGTSTASDLLYRAGSSGSFELADSTRLDSGIMILTYRNSAS
jgi:dihydrofolate reductase